MKYTLIFLSLFPASIFAQECDALFQQHLKTDMSLGYKEFDQTMGQGFRSMIKPGLDCHKEAALLIEKYIEVNDAKQSSLRWHVAQSWAHAGDYTKAVKWSQSVLLEAEDFSTRELRWNNFVLGNIAFFEKDLDMLIQHRDIVAAANDKHFGNKLNSKFLDSLVENFEQSYKYATEHIKQ